MSSYLNNGTLTISSYGLIALIIGITHIHPLPVIVQMLCYTSATIFLGAQISTKQLLVNPLTGEIDNKKESITSKDAMLFPLIGSCALFGLYLAYKFLPVYWVNLLITTYLTLIGSFAFTETLCQLLELFIDTNNYYIVDKYIQLWGFLANKDDEKGYKISLTIYQITAFIFSFIIGCIWLYTDSWIIHNLFAVAFCIQAISFISLGNFKIATILLVGLFFYDIFWVFGTDVMVTVAKSFSGPAKIIFPISYNPWKQSILGLGDIVIPGLFISLCLRFDISNSLNKKDLPHEFNKLLMTNISKPTFNTVFLFYHIGLIATACIMFYFRAAQPALLYLVPCCLLSFCYITFKNDLVNQAWNYNEENSSEENKLNDSEQKDKKEDTIKNNQIRSKAE